MLTCLFGHRHRGFTRLGIPQYLNQFALSTSAYRGGPSCPLARRGESSRRAHYPSPQSTSTHAAATGENIKTPGGGATTGKYLRSALPSTAPFDWSTVPPCYASQSFWRSLRGRYSSLMKEMPRL